MIPEPSRRRVIIGTAPQTAILTENSCETVEALTSQLHVVPTSQDLHLHLTSLSVLPHLRASSGDPTRWQLYAKATVLGILQASAESQALERMETRHASIRTCSALTMSPMLFTTAS